MDIEIVGVKNILSLKYSVEDKKVNYIFGISGTGKSSIIDAIDFEDLCKIKTDNDQNIIQKVKVNNLEVNKDDFLIFDDRCLEEYIYNKNSSNNASDILVDGEKLESIIKKFNQKINKLSNELHANDDDNEIYKSKLEELGIKSLTTKGSFLKSSKIYKNINNIKNTNFNILNKLFGISMNELNWIIEGNKLIKENNICPFCENTITKERLNYLNSFSETNSEIRNGLDLFELKVFDNEEDKNKKMDEIGENYLLMFKAYEEYNEIIELFDELTFSNPFEIDDFSLEISDNLINFYPKIKKFKEKFDKEINKVKNLVFETVAKTKRILSNSTNVINKELEQFGIPYILKSVYTKQNKTQYKLILKNNKGKDDDYKLYLSTGEKIIFSLILFLHRVKKSNCKYVIIDDPVSSYDEFKRHIIYNLILNYCKDKTAIVLSHDSVFAKYSVIDYSKRTTAKYMYNNNGNVEFKNITKDNFLSFEKTIKNRLKKINNNGNYYQKVLNLRLLYEAKSKTKNIRYKYLSAIIHGVNKKQIVSDDGYLYERDGTKTNILETEVIARIKKDVYSGLQLEKLEDDYNKNIKTNDFQTFEKILALRELSNCKNADKQLKSVKSELDNYSHCNTTLQIVLNPYLFPLCSKHVYELLNKYINSSIDIIYEN